MTYYRHLDPLYHETHFADEILKVQDYVKQYLFVLKDADTHISWTNDTLTWREYTIKFGKKRNEYEFWMQKVQDLKDDEPIFSDYPEERCLRISKFFMYNFTAPLRMNIHRRYDAEKQEWTMGWVMDPEELIDWAMKKFIHHYDQTIKLNQGKVQWMEILKSNTNYGYQSVFGQLNEFIYTKVEHYINQNNIDLDTYEMFNQVTYPDPTEITH